jgi:hypothetical protein
MMDYGPIATITGEDDKATKGLHFLPFDNELIDDPQVSSSEKIDETSNLGLITIDAHNSSATWYVPSSSCGRFRRPWSTPFNAADISHAFNHGPLLLL